MKGRHWGEWSLLGLLTWFFQVFIVSYHNAVWVHVNQWSIDFEWGRQCHLDVDLELNFLSFFISVCQAMQILSALNPGGHYNDKLM
jgi:hypothetical protein